MASVSLKEKQEKGLRVAIGYLGPQRALGSPFYRQGSWNLSMDHKWQEKVRKRVFDSEAKWEGVVVPCRGWAPPKATVVSMGPVDAGEVLRL